MQITDTDNLPIDLIGLISITDGIVHLEVSFNPDACCCSDDPTGTIIQREDYVKYGWNEPKDNPRLASDFWRVWTDWNGEMLGGIYLDDECTYERAEQDIRKWGEIVTPDRIKDLPDGKYVVVPPEH